jgi:2-amino-4-hydroxy-6-hydroxymethyldihydropteridine diphosphokinase
MRYFLGLGSNIAPRTHIPLMVAALAEISPRLHVGRVLETAPVGLVGEPFLNVPVSITSELAPQQLKAFCNGLEARLGRDRSDPASKVKSRTADLDILFWLDEAASSAEARLLPQEPYMRPMLLELLIYLGIAADAERPELPGGVTLTLGDLRFGAAPRTLELVEGRLRPA